MFQLPEPDEFQLVDEGVQTYAQGLYHAGEDIARAFPQVRFVRYPEGAVPVQADGDFGTDGTEFYFRYRGGIASLLLHRAGSQQELVKVSTQYGASDGGMLGREAMVEVFAILMGLLPSEERREDQPWLQNVAEQGAPDSWAIRNQNAAPVADLWAEVERQQVKAEDSFLPDDTSTPF